MTSMHAVYRHPFARASLRLRNSPQREAGHPTDRPGPGVRQRRHPLLLRMTLGVALLTLGLVALATPSPAIAGETTGWYCFRQGEFIDMVDIWWGHTAGDAAWACNNWLSACGNGGGCMAKRWYHCNVDLRIRMDGCSGGDAGGRAFFASACNAHDLCYSRPWEARGIRDGKTRCDDQFWNDMGRLCENASDRGLCYFVRGAWMPMVQGPIGHGSYNKNQGWAAANCSP